MLENHAVVHRDSGIKTRALTYILSVPSPPHVSLLHLITRSVSVARLLSEGVDALPKPSL